MIQELTAIADAIDAFLALFVDGGSMHGLILPTKHAASFKALAIEAKSILDQELGDPNDYSTNLIYTVNAGSGGFISGPSYACVEETIKIIHAGVRAVKRKRALPPAPIANSRAYVDPDSFRGTHCLHRSPWLIQSAHGQDCSAGIALPFAQNGPRTRVPGPFALTPVPESVSLS